MLCKRVQLPSQSKRRKENKYDIPVSWKSGQRKVDGSCMGLCNQGGNTTLLGMHSDYNGYSKNTPHSLYILYRIPSENNSNECPNNDIK